MSGRRSPVALLGVLLLLLAGCATIPTAGPVQQPSPAVAPPNDPDLIVVPNTPAPNADPEEIVRGFVQAATEGRDYAVAKQFLTTSMAASWEPNAHVYLHEQAWRTTRTAGDRVQLQVPTIGEVDGVGAFRSGTVSRTLGFDLQQVKGQWRIAKAPDGVVMTEAAFQRVFSRVDLQFYDAAFQRFVPDVRWFPRAEQTAATVAALLAGPSAPLGGGAVVSAFPADTALSRPVQSGGGILSVSVRTTIAPSARMTDRMQQQLAASLSRSPSTIRLTVDGALADVAPQSDVEQPNVGADPAVLVGGRFGSLSAARGFTEDRSIGGRIAAEKPTRVTVSSRQRLAAVLTGKGQVAVVTPTGARVVDTRSGLVAPTLDQRGWTYSVPRDDPSGFIAVSPSGVRTELPGLGGTSVLSIEASWDGTRMLVLLGTDHGPVAYVAGIERDGDGAPIALTSTRFPVDLDGLNAIDATWIDGSTVGVLVSSSDAQTVVSQLLGGFTTTLGLLSNAREVVGGSRPEELRALGAAGVLQGWSGTGWRTDSADSARVQVLAVQR